MTWAQMKCEGESSLWLSLFLNFVCFCFCFGFWSRSLPLGKGLTDGWCWFQGQGVDCSVTLGSYPPQGGREALECGRHLTFLLVTRATQISWSAVEKYRLVLCPAFPRGSFSSSVVYSLSLDYIPYPKTNVPLSSQAVPLWLSFLTHLVFFSLDGPSPDAWHLLSGLDATWSLKPLNALSAQPQDTGILPVSCQPCLVLSLSRVSNLSLSLSPSWELGIIFLWMYRDRVLFFTHNTDYSFLFVHVGYIAWGQQVPSVRMRRLNKVFKNCFSHIQWFQGG